MDGRDDERLKELNNAERCNEKTQIQFAEYGTPFHKEAVADRPLAITTPGRISRMRWMMDDGWTRTMGGIKK